jgi:hypothetical protein
LCRGFSREPAILFSVSPPILGAANLADPADRSRRGRGGSALALASASALVLALGLWLWFWLNRTSQARDANPTASSSCIWMKRGGQIKARAFLTIFPSTPTIPTMYRVASGKSKTCTEYDTVFRVTRCLMVGLFILGIQLVCRLELPRKCGGNLNTDQR